MNLFRWLVPCALALSLTMCDGDSSSPSSPTTPPPATTTTTTVRPSNAQLSLTGSYVCTDPFCDGGNYTLALTNSGGVGASINYMRLKNQAGTTVTEIGAQEFVRAFGSNRVEAGNTLRFTLSDAQIVFALVIGYTDDNFVTSEITWFTVKA